MPKDLIWSFKIPFKEERMNIGTVGQSTPYSSYFDNQDSRSSDKASLWDKKSSTPVSSMNYSAQAYSSSSLNFTYQNADGDSFELQYSETQYQSLNIAAATNNMSDEDQQKLADEITQTFLNLKNESMAQLFKNMGWSTQDSTQANSTSDTQESSEIKGLPEYWNAENTSQRIVDFATSFMDVFKGAPEEFLKTIKDAIELGFSQAKSIMGELPGVVGKLVNDTHSLAMEKLDKWAQSKGIGVDQNAATAVL